jgi:NhaP-type Na+/H+ or K+/H+ antiporter
LQEGVHVLAEITLVMVLFADAARISIRRLDHDHNVPVRLLAIGLPLTIALGAAVGYLMFPRWPVWETALLAAILAPTDAALGQAVVTMESVPVRLRQALNVESGLNDGIALPFVLMFAGLAANTASNSGDWARFAAMQLILGPVVGVVVGYVGARLIRHGRKSGWISESFEGIVVMALAFVVYTLAQIVGGNGFIASFVGGMVFGNTVDTRTSKFLEFTESEGQLLVLATFFLFGALMVPDLAAASSPSIWIYAILSLTLIRLLPVAISLTGTGLKVSSVLFLGWFGPRGLASILYVLTVLEDYQLGSEEGVYATVVATVLLSIFLHGATAAPAAKAISTKSSKWRAQEADCADLATVSEFPTRRVGK